MCSVGTLPSKQFHLKKKKPTRAKVMFGYKLTASQLGPVSPSVAASIQDYLAIQLVVKEAMQVDRRWKVNFRMATDLKRILGLSSPPTVYIQILAEGSLAASYYVHVAVTNTETVFVHCCPIWLDSLKELAAYKLAGCLGPYGKVLQMEQGKEQKKEHEQGQEQEKEKELEQGQEKEMDMQLKKEQEEERGSLEELLKTLEIPETLFPVIKQYM